MTPHAPKRKAATPEPAAPTSRQEVANLEGHLTPHVGGPTARAVWHRRGPSVAAHHRDVNVHRSLMSAVIFMAQVY